MQKPSGPTIPGMTDTLDFVKNLWGSMGVPGTGMPGMSGIASPTLSTEDLDKRIADLKAVESWLNLNITMLRGTIQTMEVQRGTLAALKSMSASMAEAMGQSGAGADKVAANPFAAFFGAPAQQGAARPPASPAAGPSAAAASAGGSTAQPGAAAAPGADAGAAAVAWWNVLQNQFQQAVTSAMSAPAAPGASAGAAPNAGAPAGAAAPGKPAAAATPPAADANAARPAPPSGAGAAPAADSRGNGKERASKSKSDKS